MPNPLPTNLPPPRFRRDSDEEAEERGHRRYVCRKHKTSGWTDDSGFPECCYGDMEREAIFGKEDEDE